MIDRRMFITAVAGVLLWPVTRVLAADENASASVSGAALRTALDESGFTEVHEVARWHAQSELGHVGIPVGLIQVLGGVVNGDDRDPGALRVSLGVSNWPRHLDED